MLTIDLDTQPGDTASVMPMRWRSVLVVSAVLLASCPAWAEVEVLPGLSVRLYVTGEGFDSTESRAARGIPAASTLTFDPEGVLYLARTGRRYMGGEAEDKFALYRIPVGGARLMRDSESRYLHGPPLPNPQVGAVRGARELFVTTFDRDRKIGVLYRIVDGRAELFAGGTPDPGQSPVLKQPEGVVIDPAGGFFVADRDRGVIVRLDGNGRVVDPRYAVMTRPRVLAVESSGALWVGSDAAAEAPWQPGPGEIWHVSREGEPRLVLSGPVPQAISLSPGGHLLVADRQGAQSSRSLRTGCGSTSRGSRTAMRRGVSPLRRSRPRHAAPGSPAISSSSPSTAAPGRSTRCSASRGPSTTCSASAAARSPDRRYDTPERAATARCQCTRAGGRARKTRHSEDRG